MDLSVLDLKASESNSNRQSFDSELSVLSSRNSTPTSESSEAYGSSGAFKIIKPQDDPLKKIRSYLNKITDRSFDKITEEILRINLLEESSDPTDTKNQELILPVVKTFLSNICVFERNEETMNVYVKLFCKMKNKWSGIQGDLLMQIMMIELKKFFQQYAKDSIESEESKNDKKRNSCFKLCRFISLLYNEEAIPFTLVAAILNTFRKPNKLYLEVFCKIYSDCQKKLYNEPTFKEKVFPIFTEFLQTSSKCSDLEPMHRFMCQNILDETKTLK